MWSELVLVKDKAKLKVVVPVLRGQVCGKEMIFVFMLMNIDYFPMFPISSSVGFEKHVSGLEHAVLKVRNGDKGYTVLT